VAAALEAATPALRALGAAMAGGEVLLVPGNHDHGLVRPWLDGAAPLGLEARVAPRDASPAAARLAEALGPARVEIAYPGVWLRDDVYATHGHYLDLHTTVPTFERLGTGVMRRLVGAPGERARPDEYEAVLAPIYAWIDAAAQRAPRGRDPAGAGRAGEVWSQLTASGRRPLRTRLLRAGFPLGVAAVNAAGLGPVRADVTGEGLRRGGLGGMRAAIGRLGIGAPHVDDRTEWAAGATQLHNTGSWIYAPGFVGDRGPAGPYWPGGAIALDGAGGAPRQLRLLADLGPDELRAPARG
jgi:hypothetical protein